MRRPPLRTRLTRTYPGCGCGEGKGCSSCTSSPALQGVVATGPAAGQTSSAPPARFAELSASLTRDLSAEAAGTKRVSASAGANQQGAIGLQGVTPIYINVGQWPVWDEGVYPLGRGLSATNSFQVGNKWPGQWGGSGTHGLTQVLF